MDLSAARFIDLSASADYLGPGAIETPKYQAEIVDLVRRRGHLGRRINYVPATGAPSRYFEQVRIVEGSFENVRNLGFTPSGDPTRRERAIHLKAIQAGLSFGIFDVEVTRAQGQHAGLVAKDIADAVQGVLRTGDRALWQGSDTDLAIPTTLEYCGGITQINRTASVSSTASIVDALKAEVAAMMNSAYFDVRPTAIYVSPVLGDLIDQEERLLHRQVSQVEVAAGIRVNAIATQAGMLPLLPDWSLPSSASATESGRTDYKAAILTEELVEFHYLTSKDPRVFTLGLEGSLATRYLVVHFGAPVFKGKANASQSQATAESSLTTYAHTIVTVTR